MQRKTVTIGKPVAVAGVTLIPVTKLSLNCQHIGGSISLFGIRQPVSIIVAAPSTSKAFRITGEEVSLDQLIQEVPSIAEALERA
jgi:uncharacterized spore protein YtfJ